MLQRQSLDVSVIDQHNIFCRSTRPTSWKTFCFELRVDNQCPRMNEPTTQNTGHTFLHLFSMHPSTWSSDVLSIRFQMTKDVLRYFSQSINLHFSLQILITKLSVIFFASCTTFTRPLIVSHYYSRCFCSSPLFIHLSNFSASSLIYSSLNLAPCLLIGADVTALSQQVLTFSLNVQH